MLHLHVQYIFHDFSPMFLSLKESIPIFVRIITLRSTPLSSYDSQDKNYPSCILKRKFYRIISRHQILKQILKHCSVTEKRRTGQCKVSPHLTSTRKSEKDSGISLPFLGPVSNPRLPSGAIRSFPGVSSSLRGLKRPQLRADHRSR